MTMKRVQWLLMFASITGLTACGGGGGSNGSSQVKSSAISLNSSSALSFSSTTTSGGAISSSMVNSSEASSQLSASSTPAVLNDSPTVSIVFPRQNARIDQATITVQGTATDDKGISSIKVNGVEASFDPINNAISAAQQSRVRKSGGANAGLAKAQTEEAVSVSWTATIPLVFGQTDINVEVMDSEGESAGNSDQPVKINNARVPLAIIKDSTNHRFISYEQFPEIFSVDMTTLAMARLPDSRYESGASLSNDATEIFSVKNEDGFLKIYSSKIATGHISVKGSYDLQFDMNLHNWISVDGTLSTDPTTYFVLATYGFHDNAIATKILKVDLESGQVTILSEKKDEDIDYKDLKQIFYVDNYLIGTTSRNDNNIDLIKIDSTTGDQETFIEDINYGLLSINDIRDSIYIINRKSVSKINIANEVINNITFSKQDDMLEFAQQAAFVVDEEHNRLVVSDPGLGQLVLVDTITGELTFLTENGIGTGPKLVWPNQIAVTPDNKFAYVLDSRLEATEMLFKIDLSTGDREVISDLSIYTDDSATALVLDEAHNRIFVAFGLTIGIVDLVTEEHQIIANQSIGLGPIINGIGDMVYDDSEDRLLVTGSSQEFVIAIDLKTNERSILFDQTTGTGPAFTPMASLALDKQNNLLYLSTAQPEELTKVIAVDLETGNRTELFERCDGHSVSYKYDANLELDPATNTLTMLANNELFKYDLENKTCTVLPVSAYDIAYLSDSTLLGVKGHGLYQINPNNGEQVVISQ